MSGVPTRQLILDDKPVPSAPAPKRKRKPPRKTWVNLINGMEYVWNVKRQLWIATGRYPYGESPMGF